MIAPHVQDYAIRCTLATHPQGQYSVPIVNQFLRVGASPRGAQALVLAGKVRALLEGRYNVSFEDIRRVYLPALRHRVLLNFEAQAENIPSDTVLLNLVKEVKEKGPELVTAEEVGDPHELGIRLRLNGRTMQDSTTRQMIFPVWDVVSYLSQVFTLEPGDLVYTGTPPGVGFARKPPVFLKPGDVCEVEIDGLGVLRNPVVGS